MEGSFQVLNDKVLERGRSVAVAERDLAPGTEMSRSSFCNGLRELFNGRGRLSAGRLAAEGT